MSEICKITVIKRMFNPDLASKYVLGEAGPCNVFIEGQEFIVSSLFEKPLGFCDWAWNDLFKSIVTLSRGGNFSTGVFSEWMNQNNISIECCSEGIRPVVFKIEKIS